MGSLARFVYKLRVMTLPQRAIAACWVDRTSCFVFLFLSLFSALLAGSLARSMLCCWKVEVEYSCILWLLQSVFDATVFYIYRKTKQEKKKKKKEKHSFYIVTNIDTDITAIIFLLENVHFAAQRNVSINNLFFNTFFSLFSLSLYVCLYDGCWSFCAHTFSWLI